MRLVVIADVAVVHVSAKLIESFKRKRNLLWSPWKQKTLFCLLYLIYSYESVNMHWDSYSVYLPRQLADPSYNKVRSKTAHGR